MSWILFVDESGQDHRDSPYEVLAGLAVEDSRAWNLVTAIRNAEVEMFGARFPPHHELKGRELLKKKTFRFAGQLPPIEPALRTQLVQSCLEKGRRQDTHVTKAELTALGQAKIAYVERVLELCAQHQARAFASIVDRDSPRPAKQFLRKDYAYLFERYFYFLEEQPSFHQGLVVFDELERTQSHILIDQMAEYFLDTAKGRARSARIIPEPLFVHSDLTTLVRATDFIAYVVAWGARVGTMTRPRRDELGALAERVVYLRHRATRERDGQPFYVWSFAVINDLRPRDEQP